ncbi:MAG: DUF4173 domain-containing protein [Bacillota bacterium]|nr:DUF4173 domain-containing protein [Bacillota bacterium]
MEQSQKIIETRKNVTVFILFSLIAGVLFSAFFFDYVGISYAIYVTYLTAGYFAFYRVRNKSLMGYFLLVISLILSVSYAIFTNPVFRVLNLLVIPVSLFSSFLLLTYSNITLELKKFTKNFIDKIILDSILTSFKLPGCIIGLAKHKEKRDDSTAYKSVLIGLGISAPIVMFLCVLLSGADSMFSYYLRNLTYSLRFLDMGIAFYKLISAIIITFCVFGLYLGLSYKLNSMEGEAASKRSFEALTVITILTVISMLYIVFTKVQVSYLYVGGTLPLGITRAEYARSGFFQLVFLVVINLMMITILKLKTKNQGKKQNLTLDILYTIITLLTFNMAFSALYKMNLYIAAFGYTRLRILVQVFTIFLFLVLGILIVFIWKSINLFRPIIFVAAVIYVSLNFFNIDNYIASRNISMSSTLTNFDKEYLNILSLDASPAMAEAVREKKISSEEYYNWLVKNQNNEKYWYEYNYYSSKFSK